MTLELKTDVSGIGELLKAHRFTVPDHQRAFAWSEDEVDELWNDVVNAMSEEPDGYFLGQIVLGVGPDDDARREIIDGQQRLATVSLIYAAIVATLRDRSDTEEENAQRADEIDRDFLATKDKRSLERTHRLQLGPLDNAFFESVLTASATDSLIEPAHRASHRLLQQAYDRAKARVQSFAPVSDPEWLEKLLQLSDYLEAKVVVIAVNAGSEENAYLIFETLNDRGVQLTPADLLKNLLFARAREKLDETQSWWASMAGSLEALPDQPSPLTLYIRHYFISTTEHVRDKGLYKKIKETKKTPAQVLRFVRDLASESEAYVALTNSQSPTWVNEREREAIRTIGIFKARTVRPLLLAIAKQPASANRTKLLEQVMRSTVRLAVTGRLGKGPTEEGIGAAARKVRGGGVTSAAKLRTALGGAAVSDADFQTAFETFTIKNGRQARYLLRALEVQVREDHGDSDELSPEVDESKVNWEHVLPKNPPAGAWGVFSKDQVDVYAHRLGNQVLLKAALNRKLKTGDYALKEATLAASELRLTSTVAGHADWTIQEIEKRQRELAALALKVW